MVASLLLLVVALMVYRDFIPSYVHMRQVKFTKHTAWTSYLREISIIVIIKSPKPLHHRNPINLSNQLS